MTTTREVGKGEQRLGPVLRIVLVGLAVLAVCAGHVCATGTTFAPALPEDIKLSADGDASTFHDLVFDGDAYVAVWPTRELGRAGIQGQFIGTDGAKGFSFLIPDGNAATNPRIARSGGGFLVVYTAGSGIFGSVVDAGGGAGPIFSICTAANTQDYPAVIAGGPNLLVVWQDYRAYTSTGIDIYGRLVSPSGSLVGDEFRIGPASGNQRNPIGSFNGQDYVVIWTQGAADPTDEDLYGARVAPDGKVRDPEGFPICTAGGSRVTLNAACTAGPNGETALAWTDTRTSPTSLYWTTVSREGTVRDVTPSSSGELVFRDSSYPPGYPSILYNGREYVVFFTSHSKVIAALVGTDGAVRLPQRVPVVYGSSPARTACAYDGANYLLSYATTGIGQVFAQLVTDANHPPIADAGTGYTFAAGHEVGVMDGGLSTDPGTCPSRTTG